MAAVLARESEWRGLGIPQKMSSNDGQQARGADAGPRRAFTTAIGEVFQDSDTQRVGPVDRTLRRPFLTVFETTDTLTLLDLDSGWITRAGGNQSIRTGSRAMAQRRAREIHQNLAVNGVYYGSSVWGPGVCAALWEGAARAFPVAPMLSRALDDPVLATPIAHAVDTLGTVVTL
jgi:hypothetical protein